MAEASLDHPKGQVDEVIYPVVGEQTLRNLVKEYHASGRSYREKVHTVMRGSYSHHYRRMVPLLLSVLKFHSSNDQRQPVMQALDRGMPSNAGVKILQRPQGWIQVAKMDRQPDPANLADLKAEITRRWPLTGLLAVLKETDLRVGFTQHFTGTGIRSALDDETLQRRLLLCLFGLGSNAGLKRACATPPGEQYHDLLYVRRRYLHPDAFTRLPRW